MTASHQTPPPVVTCVATKHDGTRCRMLNELNPKTGLCPYHDPEREAEVGKRRRNGGLNGGGHGLNRIPPKVVTPEEAPPPPKSLEDCVTYASWATHAVTVGLIDPKTCREVIGAVRQVQSALEKRDLERKVRELEAALRAEKNRKKMHAL